MWIVLFACADAPPPTPATTDSASAPSDETGAAPPADTDLPPTNPPAPEPGCAVDRWDPADFATVIDVGVGRAAATPSDVPWESLAPDTLVRIWPGVYHDKWVLAVAAAEDAPVVVIGVCDPETGALPVIDGADAHTRPALDYWSETRGVIKIGGSSTPSASPSWVYLEDLEIRGGRSTHTFLDDAGALQTYDDNAAAIYVEEGADVTIRGCSLTESSNGLFVSHQTRDLSVVGNHIWGNGNVGSIYEHNIYTEANGITFEGNWFGPLCDGCSGNNLKDRSAGTVIRYNWIEGGNRQLDLVESDFEDIRSEPSYRETFVYGNVLVEPDGDGNSQIVHYGGDGGTPANYRRGTLYFYHNTVISERTTNTTWVRLSDPEEQVDARNNVVWSSGPLAIQTGPGATTLATNWLVAWSDSFDGPFPGSVLDEGTNTVGADPGLEDLAGHRFAPAPGAGVIGAAGPLPEGAPPVTQAYVEHQRTAPRPDDGAPDQGAFEAP